MCKFNHVGAPGKEGGSGGGGVQPLQPRVEQASEGTDRAAREREPLCGRINEALRREWLLSDRDDLWQQGRQSERRGVGLVAELLSPSVWQSPGLSCQQTTGFGAPKQIGAGKVGPAPAGGGCGFFIFFPRVQSSKPTSHFVHLQIFCDAEEMNILSTLKDVPGIEPFNLSLHSLQGCSTLPTSFFVSDTKITLDLPALYRLFFLAFLLLESMKNFPTVG